MTVAPVDLVTVDIGNTALKVGTFSISNPLEPIGVFRTSSRTPDLKELDGWLPKTAKEGVLAASVYRDGADRFREWLAQRRPGMSFRTLTTEDFDLSINVRFPERVGHDRLAAAVAAGRMRDRERPVVVVDAGSAITVDWLDAAGVFQGGAILPGWKTMARSLEKSTDQLPMLSSLNFDAPPAVIGRSTEEAIASGLFWGSVGAVRELVDRLTAASTVKPHLFVSGGDMQTLAQHLEQPLQCVAEIVLCGIAVTAQETAGL